MRRAWIGLGANLGEREVTLERALRWLEATPRIRVDAVSRWRETMPVGPPQPPYLNGVARVETDLAPLALLDVLQRLEKAAGRVRSERWGPRTLDLDILLIEGIVYRSPELRVPHAELPFRRFVLEPLCELDPALHHPVLDRPVSDLLEALPKC